MKTYRHESEKNMTRRLKALTMVVTVLAVTCSPLRAQNDHVKRLLPTKWSQWVDMEVGQDIESHWYVAEEGGPEVALADDWRCPDGLPVTDLHWWGSYIDGQPGDLIGFLVTIFDDVPADAIHPSHPGQRLHEVFAPVGTYSEVYYGSDQSHDVYQYNLFLDPDNYFHQDQGRIYWLSIVGMAQEDNVTWGWHTAQRPAPENGLDAAVAMYDYEPLTGTYNLYGALYDQTCNIQLAFELTTVPEPASLALVGSAALVTFGVVRRRRMR